MGELRKPYPEKTSKLTALATRAQAFLGLESPVEEPFSLDPKLAANLLHDQAVWNRGPSNLPDNIQPDNLFDELTTKYQQVAQSCMEQLLEGSVTNPTPDHQFPSETDRTKVIDFLETNFGVPRGDATTTVYSLYPLHPNSDQVTVHETGE